MRKWAIKRSPYSGTLEVWEYIDTVEEAKKYPYVAKAIREHGADKVVPLAMNRMGGYHHLPRDDKSIVRIVESEEEPSLSVYEQYPVNPESLSNGWLSPDGTIFECGSFGHIGCAMALCEEYEVPQAGTIHGDEALLEHGWIKIFNGQWYGRWKKINDRQIEVLESKGIKSFYMLGVE